MKHLRTLAAVVAVVGLISVLAIVLVLANRAGAEREAADVKPASSAFDPQFFDDLKADYASINSVDAVSRSKISLYVDGKQVDGEAELRFAADGNKYRYESKLDEILNKAGLMRDIKIWFDGSKMYLYDDQAGVLSFQTKEDIHLPIAIPNPLFLPIDFFSADTDECANCKLRLTDLRTPGSWDQRRKGLRSILNDVNDVGIHQVVEIPGGVREGKEFVYHVRLLGPEGDVRVNSIDMKTPEGKTLAEIIFADHRTVAGFKRKIPYSYIMVVRDESSRVLARIDSKIESLAINDARPDAVFAPDLKDFSKVWDSESKKMIKDN